MATFASRLRELDKAATPGPWGHDSGSRGPEIAPVGVDGNLNWSAEVCATLEENGDNDAPLIVLLRNSAARLAAVVEAGWATVDRYEAAGLTSQPMRALRAALTALDTEPT